MNALLQISSDWRVLLFAAIIVVFGVSRFFKGDRSREDTATLLERFHSELAAAETAVAHDAADLVFDSTQSKDPAAEANSPRS